MRRSNAVPFELSDYVLRKAFTDAGKRQGWLDAPRIAAAVSGGGDSIALLWLCSKFYGGGLAAIHINPGIRGSESDGDEAFTAKFATSLGCGFVSVRVDVPAEKRRGESLESAARRLRQMHICAVAKTLGVDTVLLGHNRDDLAETVLFNLLRGTGIRGAVGMTECSELEGVKFCRPLLGMRREFIRDILRVRGITWREDSTNNDDKYTRNYIRLKLLPLIERTINASAVEHLAQFGEDMMNVRDLEEEEGTQLLLSCLVSVSPITFDASRLRELNEYDTALVIREAGRRLGLRTLSRGRCEELAGLIRKGGAFVFQWCGSTVVTGRKGRITIHEDTGTIDAV